MSIDHLITIPLALFAALLFWRACVRERERRERRLVLAAKRRLEERLFTDSGSVKPWSATPEGYMGLMASAMRDMNVSIKQANRALAKMGRVFARSLEYDRLRTRAYHFATPRWKRALYQLQLRWYVLRHYRRLGT